MTVRKILSLKGSDVLTIAPEKKLLDAIALLAKHKIGALVVTGSNREVVGIISERDIVRLLSNTDNNRFENTVASAMTKEVKTCKPEDTIQRSAPQPFLRYRQARARRLLRRPGSPHPRDKIRTARHD